MPRKFSLDIAKLKIGPQKPDRPMREYTTQPFDSPPQTPKSVRPPLPVGTESDLRLACAYILSGVNPSIQHNAQKAKRAATNPLLDHGVPKAAIVPRHTDAVSSSHPALIGPKVEQNKALPDPERYRKRPEGLTNPRDGQPEPERARVRERAASRADELMAGSSQPTIERPTTRERTTTHLRSRSVPQPPQMTSSKTEPIPRPVFAPRSESVETAHSLARTDATEDRLTASTAGTSAAATPARSSKRTSTQAMHPGFDPNNMPVTEPADHKWMRQELEKHKRLQNQHADAATAAVTAIVAAKPHIASSRPLVKVPPRKPLAPPKPTNKADAQDTRSPQALPNPGTSPSDAHTTKQHLPSNEQSANSQSQPRQRATEHEQKSDNQNDEPERKGRSTVRSRAASGARSLSRGVKEYFRPGSRSEHRGMTGDVRQSEDRSRSVAAQVKDYFRPSTSGGNRQQSFDLPSSFKRRASTDLAAYGDENWASNEEHTSTRKSRSRWNAFNRSKASLHSVDLTRPSSSNANANLKSNATRRRSQNLEHIKPAIDLNRKLPPLPRLDLWKDEQANFQTLVERRVERRVDDHANASTVISPVSLRDSSFDLAPSGRNLLEPGANKSVEPEPASSDSSEDSSKYYDAAQEPALTTPRDDAESQREAALSILRSEETSWPAMSATFSPGDFDIYGPMRTPSSISESSLACRTPIVKRSETRATELSYSSRLSDYEIESPKTAKVVSRLSTPNLRAQLIDNSHRSSSSGLGNLSQKASRQSLRPQDTVPQQHPLSLDQPQPESRHDSGTSYRYSRKASMDEAARRHDNHYQNIVEIPASTKYAPPKERAKNRWWKPGNKNTKSDWMQTVENSGSKAGVILVDETAAAPIVRY